MANYSQYNAQSVLDVVNKYIAELENLKSNDFDWKRHHRMSMSRRRVGYGQYEYKAHYGFKVDAVCVELSIFDWWGRYLSVSQLKQMKKFIEQSIRLGFDGYVCFKVGAVGCANGMWAHKEESTDGFSPKGDCVYHSFVSDENYWDVCINGEWQKGYSNQYKLADIKRILASA